jgi:hypothetical protein
MTNDELNEMIELYFDGELDKSSEPLLFTSLSGNAEGREYFKKLNLLRIVINESTLPFPAQLEEKILNSIKVEKHGFMKNINVRNIAFRFISVTAVVILIIISSLFFLELKDSKSKLDSISEQVKQQKETIDMIIDNNYPAVVISPENNNEIIVRANSRRKI